MINTEKSLMPYYAIIGLDHPPHSMAKRETFRAAHRAYVLGNDQSVMLAGPLLDDDNNQCGSFYIFEAQDETQIRQWLEREPFVKNGVYCDLIVRRFEPGVNRIPLSDWPTGSPSPSAKV
jgi:uncharacterized protein